MSAVNILVQKRRGTVSMMVDGAAYYDDGIIAEMRRKAHVVNQHTAVGSTGVRGLADRIVEELEDCVSFDHVADVIEDRGPVIYKDAASWCSHAGAGEIYITGFSDRRQAPAAYVMRVCKPDMMARFYEMARESNRSGRAFELMPIEKFVGTPVPTPAEMDAAKFKLPTSNEVDALDPSTTLLHLLECQRQVKAEQNGGAHIVGGHAQLITIGAAGVIEDRIVHEWPDVVDRLIEPRRPKWGEHVAACAAARLSATVDTSGMSRLQRDRMLKKARKGTLRIA